MKQAVICLVKTYTQADALVGQLKSEGFPATDISVLMPDENGVRDMSYEKHSKAPEGTSAGAASGAILGGALGVLAGIGALTIPGLGPFIAAVGGAVGGITGGLIGLGVPEYEAIQYEGKLKEGNLLISVHTEDKEKAKRAEQVCKSNGASDINCVNEEKVPTNR